MVLKSICIALTHLEHGVQELQGYRRDTWSSCAWGILYSCMVMVLHPGGQRGVVSSRIYAPAPLQERVFCICSLAHSVLLAAASMRESFSTLSRPSALFGRAVGVDAESC